MALESIHAFLKRKRDDGEQRKRKDALAAREREEREKEGVGGGESGLLRALAGARAERGERGAGGAGGAGVGVHEKCEADLESAGERIEELEVEVEQARTREAVYKKLIERYADVIEAGEEKTIPELRALINPEDEAVREAKAHLLSDFPRYDYDRHFARFADKAFELIASLRPVHAGISVSYWLSPREVLELGAADAFDKAVFLCSLLRAGGNASARVRVVELEGGIQHPVAVFEFHGKAFLFDAASKTRQSAASAAALFDKLCCGGKKPTRSLYEFNDQNYEEFEESA
jgi:hypothetical protein